jgi:RNA polymerase sigma-70 factor, ECF subfamily
MARVLNLVRLRTWIDDAVALSAPSGVRDNARLFEGLVEAHYKHVYNLALRMVRSEADAADLTQETFVRVYRSLPRLRAEGAQLAWIRRIATNLCLDHLRRRRAAPPACSLDALLADSPDLALFADQSDAGSDPYRHSAAEERKQVLHRALGALPDDYRALIVLHHVEGMGVEEIGDALGVPPGTVKSRLSRARKALRRKLAPYFDPA